MTGASGLHAGAAGSGQAGNAVGFVLVLIAGAVLAWHGLRVYTGRKRVSFWELKTVKGTLRRPDLDLVGAWGGSGLALLGLGGLLHIVQSGPVAAVAVVVEVAGGVGILLGLAFYVYLPRRLRPAWSMWPQRRPRRKTGRRPPGKSRPEAASGEQNAS
jgi:hypothetical protein